MPRDGGVGEELHRHRAERLVAALADPRLAIDKGSALGRELATIAVGRSTIEPPAGDRRFTDPTWVGNPVYRRTMQAYLACGQSLDAFNAQSGLEPRARARARYLAATLASTLAPTNALIGNPAALKLALETGGRSFVRGLANR